MTTWQTTFQAMILEVILLFYMMPSHASNVKIWDDPAIIAYNNLQTASEGQGYHNPENLPDKNLLQRSCLHRAPKNIWSNSYYYYYGKTKQDMSKRGKEVSLLVYSCYSTLNHSLDLAQHSRILCTFKKLFSLLQNSKGTTATFLTKLTNTKNKIKKHTNKSASLLILICTASARIHHGSLKNPNTHIHGRASPSPQLGQPLRIVVKILTQYSRFCQPVVKGADILIYYLSA